MKLYILVVAATLAAGSTFAHDIERGPNGGKVVDTGLFHVELVANGKVVNVYLTDKDNKAVPASGYKGLAIIVAGGKTQRIELAPAGENRLTGTTREGFTAAPKGAVRLTNPDGTTSQAKFD
jgi:hypothetical protein